MAILKARKEMCCTQSVLRIEEAKRFPLGTVCEVDPVKPSRLPARSVLLAKLIMPYP